MVTMPGGSPISSVPSMSKLTSRRGIGRSMMGRSGSWHARAARVQRAGGAYRDQIHVPPSGRPDNLKYLSHFCPEKKTPRVRNTTPGTGVPGTPLHPRAGARKDYHGAMLSIPRLPRDVIERFVVVGAVWIILAIRSEERRVGKGWRV